MSEMAPVCAGAILHVGCGTSPLPDWLTGEETRVDIDARHKPDIIASMTNLGEIGEFDAVFCSHALEHLFPHDALIALSEFHRVLRPGGVAWIVVPNLTGISPTFDVVYESEAGPITGFHMVYGNPHHIVDNPFMAHRCGFVPETLENALQAAGFGTVRMAEHTGFNLVGIGIK